MCMCVCVCVCVCMCVCVCVYVYVCVYVCMWEGGRVGECGWVSVGGCTSRHVCAWGAGGGGG